MKLETMVLTVSSSAQKGGVPGIAAILGTNKTSELVLLGYPLAITRTAVDFEVDQATSSVHCCAQMETVRRTGVEVEAFTAIQVSLLTIYDMSLPSSAAC
ncbi:cyclic pyranopterin monophosphate synthase MoaC [Massilia sp. DJPM01]|uniref:cyclic pyranopterin monophosphate synthase MoaC n=1 Tax=Massilia sp. DJPM01 TaxID=3024404 RepID=UPI0028058371|nr:cyclic pyranopterin monophosphate synthase MoaC [Massilia sp. DJPM01]